MTMVVAYEVGFARAVAGRALGLGWGRECLGPITGVWSIDTSIDNVGLHLKNIFVAGELEESATTEDYSVVQAEGQ